MTWIAACNGQRGIYQETIMTDEERRKLVAELRGTSFHPTWYIRGQAADEIERLATELEKYKKLYSETEEAGWEGYAGMTDEERQKLIARFKSHEVVMWTDIDLAAEELERLEKELANANRLLEINRRRSLEKSGGLEIKQSDVEPSLSDQMYGFHGAGFDSSRGAGND